VSLRDISRRHVGLVALYSTRYSVRSGSGLVFLLLVLLAGLMIADTFLGPIERAGGISGPETQRFLAQTVAWALDDIGPAGPGAWTLHVVRRCPAALAAIFLVLLFVAPLLCAVGGFNQFAGDIGNRGLRYHLLRTERANIFFGRYLGAVAYTWVSMTVLIAVVSLYLGIKIGVYETRAMVLYSLHGVMAMCVATLPYLALCAWISAAVGSSFGSLLTCYLVIGGVPLAAKLAVKATHSEYASYVKWVLPWGVQNRLFHPDAQQVVLAVLACIGYAAVYALLGYRHFAKRDL
jgi:hypothetical protein